MELVGTKKNKSRKRKRYLKNKQRRLRQKLEVKGTTRRKSSFANNMSSMTSYDPQNYTMLANTFWENYKKSQDWQQRHNVAWWKSRCLAVEHENEILRRKIRIQASHLGRCTTLHATKEKNKVEETMNESEIDDGDNEDENSENLEFEVDKDMLDFLEKSIRHKMELKRLREMEINTTPTNTSDDMTLITYNARIRAKTKDAELLYGEAGPRIMAMEAALHATIDRHRDRACPHYWPIIPLKP